MSKKIVVVEDEKSISGPLADALKEEGFDVSVANNGKEGLDLIKEKKPELVLMDIIMPEVGGVELLNELRKDENLKDTNVVVLSNVDSEGGISDVMSIGVYDYLIKTDYSLDAIVNKVKDKLRK